MIFVEGHKLFEHALNFGSDAHRGQTRKGSGEPYFNHCIRVARTVAENGGDANQMIAALLHDTVEDTSVTLNEIEARFGVDVRNLVAELTDQYTPQTHPKENRAQRKLWEAKRLSTISDRAKLIKWADIADNTRDIVVYDPNFAPTYLREKTKLLEAIGYSEEPR